MKFKIQILYFIISIVLFIYTFYRSEIIWDGERRDYYLIYYIVSIFFFILSLLIFYFRSIGLYTIIIFFSVVFSLYLTEFYYLVKVSNKNDKKNLSKKIKIFEKNNSKNYDRRSLKEIYNDSKIIDEKIVISISPENFLFESSNIFPLGGISNSKTIHCNENGYFSSYISDRYGFNNPDSEWDEDEIEFMLIGDSFTHGACVNRPNDIGSNLRKLSNKSVLNLGYSGNGPLVEYATLREYISPKVKNVLWIFYDNDLEELINELKSDNLKKYFFDTDYSQNLMNQQNNIDELLNNFIHKKNKEEIKKDYNEILRFLKLYKVRVNIKSIFKDVNKYENDISKDKLEEILNMAKVLTKKNESNFYFIYLTGYKNNKEDYKKNYFKDVKDIVRKLDINLIDIEQSLLSLENDPKKMFPFNLPGHFNIFGYKKVSEKIYEAMKDN